VQQLQASDSDIDGVYRGFDGGIGRNHAIRSSTAVSRHEGTSTITRLTMSDGAGVGHWDVLRLHDDLLVCAADSYYSDQLDLVVCPPVDLLSMRFIVSGALQLRAGRKQRVVARQGSASVARLPAVRSHAVGIEPRKRLASLTLHFPADKLPAIMGMEPDELPELLRKFLQPEDALQYCSMPLLPAMKNAVLDVVDAPFDDRLRRRYLEAKAMELFCLFVDAAGHGPGGHERAAPLTSADRGRLYEVRSILSTQFLDPPSISELARAVGINRTKLQRDFKEAFGTTIFDFCHHRRMSMARDCCRIPR
jgi:AraC family transcriptional regulator, transcriptional activator of the genes for pyochelin and ferripyochelin receptors